MRGDGSAEVAELLPVGYLIRVSVDYKAGAIRAEFYGSQSKYFVQLRQISVTPLFVCLLARKAYIYTLILCYKGLALAASQHKKRDRLETRL